MTKEQAKQLAAQIERDYAGLLKATPETYRNANRIRLLLVAGQRTAIVYKEREWESIKDAWIWFLQPEETIEIPPRPGQRLPAPRYLVDGQEMRIRQVRTRQKVYWIGAYQEGGKTKQRYFGKTDPRPNYPLVPEEVNA